MFIDELKENTSRYNKQLDTSYERYLKIRNRLYEVSCKGGEQYIYHEQDFWFTTIEEVNSILNWFRLDGFNNENIYVDFVDMGERCIYVKSILFTWGDCKIKCTI